MKDRNKIAREKIKQKHKKKILIYGPSCNNSTGLGKIIFMMARSLQEAGHEVLTIAQWWNKHQIYYKGVPILPDFYCPRCGSSDIGSQEYVQKIADLLNLSRPDYFITVGDPYQFQQYGLGNLILKDIKTLCYTTMDSEGYFCNDLLNLLDKPDYLDNCDKIISMAEYTKEQLKEWKELDSEVVYPPILTDLYKPVSEQVKKELRKKYRVNEDEFLIYMSGRNILRKRHNIAIEAVCELLSKTENTALFINIPPTVDGNMRYFPDGLNPVDFITRVMKHKYGRDFLAEGRIFLIDRDELGSTKISEEQNVEFYQISDVYVSTTSGEGFGLCSAEAMSCGIPIVIPDNSTADELVCCLEADNKSPYITGNSGLLVDTPIHIHTDFGTMQHLCQPEDVYQAINHLYENLKLRQVMGEQGRKHVVEMFGLDKFKQNIVKSIITTEKKAKEEKEFNKLEFESEQTKEE